MAICQRGTSDNNQLAISRHLDRLIANSTDEHFRVACQIAAIANYEALRETGLLELLDVKREWREDSPELVSFTADSMPPNAR